MAECAEQRFDDDQSSGEQHGGRDVQDSDPRLKLYHVLPEALATVWKDFGVHEQFDRIEKASGGEFTKEGVWEKLRDSEAPYHLWLVLKDEREIMSVLLTSFGAQPSGQLILTVIWADGRDSEAWIPLQDVLLDWAKESGAEEPSLLAVAAERKRS